MDMDWVIGDLALSASARPRLQRRGRSSSRHGACCPIGSCYRRPAQHLRRLESQALGERELCWNGFRTVSRSILRRYARRFLGPGSKGREERMLGPFCRSRARGPVAQLAFEERFLGPLREASARGEAVVAADDVHPQAPEKFERRHPAECLVRCFNRMRRRSAARRASPTSWPCWREASAFGRPERSTDTTSSTHRSRSQANVGAVRPARRERDLPSRALGSRRFAPRPERECGRHLAGELVGRCRSARGSAPPRELSDTVARPPVDDPAASAGSSTCSGAGILTRHCRRSPASAWSPAWRHLRAGVPDRRDSEWRTAIRPMSTERSSFVRR